MKYITSVPEEQTEIQLQRNFTDILRFVACCMVAIGHYSGYAIAKLGANNIFYDIAAAQFGYLGVALFFFLSGYGLMKSVSNKTPSFVSFLSRRLSRTYLPAVLVSILWLIISILVTGGGDLLCNQQYFLGVIWRFNDEVMWFVQTIIVLYLFFYLYIYLCSHICWKMAGLPLLLFMGTVATFLVCLLGVGDPISVPLFFIGMAVAKWPEQTRRLLRSWRPMLFCFLIILCVAVCGRYNNRTLHGLINYSSLLGFLLFCTYYNAMIPVLPKWVGGSSYDLYLTHYKIHLLIVYLFVIDQLWMFTVGTACGTFLFYHLRRALHL